MKTYKMNYCPYCGKKLEIFRGKEPNFCGRCGKRLKKLTKNNEKSIQCTICHKYLWLERDNHIKCSFCGSIYHSSCVSPWLMQYNSCPMCQNVFVNPTLT